METNYTAGITTATNQNIFLGIAKSGISKNAVARKAGIPLTTFDRKINGVGDFTLRELGAIATALDKTLADILPVALLNVKASA